MIAELRKKSQASFEFIASHGMSILMIVVMIGVFAYVFGFSPSDYIPTRCQFPTGIACTDAAAYRSTSSIKVNLKNVFPYGIINLSVTASGCSTQDFVPKLGENAAAVFEPKNCIFTGKKYSGEINLSYVILDTGLKHKASGILQTTV